MKLESRSLLLSQDTSILSRHIKPCIRKLVEAALSFHGENLSSYSRVLPHLSSFFFKHYMLSVLNDFCPTGPVDYWTNLETVGNTGAASIYIMLDEFTRKHPPAHGDKIMLFIPESGQFNFVLISLTAVQEPVAAA